MPKRYPPEFRQRVLALLDEGRRVADIASDLGLSCQTIYHWRNQPSGIVVQVLEAKP